MSRVRLRLLPIAAVVLAVLLVATLLPLLGIVPSGRLHAALTVSTHPPAPPVHGCPWVKASAEHTSNPASLAREVLDRMTLGEKLGFVALRSASGYENINDGVPRLCIPALTLQDGPNGIADMQGTTQLPASIGVAATFSPQIAYEYGRLEAAEARGKGIDVVQAPELNLARVPTSGRIFEAYGEDPDLTATMGVAAIRGIQSEGVLAEAKHFTGYTQETARLVLDESISQRALEELYLAPFHAAVTEGHVAAIMCAYGSINGVSDCSDPALYGALAGWGFDGFVRSDFAAVRDAGAAFAAGLDLIKPARVGYLRAEVADGGLPVSSLNRAVLSVLTQMFAYGLIAHPRAERPRADVATPAHARFALLAAERSIVLLKNAGGLLPLRRVRSVAIIGLDASMPTTAGSGSAHVAAPFLVTPLHSLLANLPATTAVSYTPGMPLGSALPTLPLQTLERGEPQAEQAGERSTEPGKGDLRILMAPGVTRAAATATQPVGLRLSTWAETIVPPDTGLYQLSMRADGDAWLYVDNQQVLSLPGLHKADTWSTTVTLVAGQPYRFRLAWYEVRGEPVPKLGWENVSPDIDAAVNAARSAQVAIVFAADHSGEGVDRPSLSLPGDQNVLISAVAAANHHTIVVLNTGGAVLMPWLSSVSSVLEAWYPGEQDGAAISAVLLGRFEPAGRLPITFPASQDVAPLNAQPQFPGVDADVSYREGLDIGYRYYQAYHIRPLFPFGFGLSYTSFSLTDAVFLRRPGALVIHVRLTNVGRVAGTDVVQVYLGFPPGAGEPPRQLRAFQAVTLAPAASRALVFDLPASAFDAYLGGRFTSVPGTYHVWIGESSADPAAALALRAP